LKKVIQNKTAYLPADKMAYNESFEQLIINISQTHKLLQSNVLKVVNKGNWMFGYCIVEYEQTILCGKLQAD
jgi:hypothetical protein